MFPNFHSVEGVSFSNKKASWKEKPSTWPFDAKISCTFDHLGYLGISTVQAMGACHSTVAMRWERSVDLLQRMQCAGVMQLATDMALKMISKINIDYIYETLEIKKVVVSCCFFWIM